jgi:hypothetical protein
MREVISKTPGAPQNFGDHIIKKKKDAPNIVDRKMVKTRKIHR